MRAVKIVKKSFKQASKVVDTLVNSEVEALAKLDSPNVEKLFEVFEDKYKYYMVHELLQGPNLLTYIEKLGKKPINEKLIAGYIQEILQGLSHCHAMNVIHRDVRPENIIFSDSDCKHLKLIDFKFAKSFEQSTQKFREVLGAPAYIAPEVLKKRTYSPKSDIWSSGILAYFLLSGNLPYVVTTKTPLSELFGIIEANKFTMESFKGGAWDKISAEGKSFLLRTLEADPEKRASAQDLLNDPWLSNANEKPINDESAKAYLVNMRSIIADQKFEHAVMMYIVNRADLEGKKEDLLNLFSKMDKNGDHRLSRSELRNGFKESGIVLSDKEFDKLFQKLDTDKSGYITYTEYLAGAVDASIMADEKSLEEAFRFLDKENKGYLLKSSLKDSMKKNWLSEMQIDRLFSEVDVNKDDKVMWYAII
eukprot:TRINITY_DN480_c0_g1_i14.p1 TRINITY_DN480_c0_g1~~TRINITY_DN480_c0_g1_i14.p1  ORF type:complete len:421 (-),score=165.05 TRINITY_DN480_c0_g1_i14:221-1483(-)